MTGFRRRRIDRSLKLRMVLWAAACLSLGSGTASTGWSEPGPQGVPHEAGARTAPAPINWTTGTGKWVGFWGRRETVLCPAEGKLEGAWGTDIYTDDSSICTAAVHAGLITTREGGIVTVEMRPDAGQYTGSTRNGVRTGDWMEPWTGAYVFVRSLGAEPAIEADEYMKADSWRGQTGRVLSFACRPRFELHTVFGTDVYTDDSYVCSAAVHRGLITQRQGGTVTIKLVEGQQSFEASSRNGVTSLALDGWHGQSYIFVATPPDTPAPPTTATPFERAPIRPTSVPGQDARF